MDQKYFVYEFPGVALGGEVIVIHTNKRKARGIAERAARQSVGRKVRVRFVREGFVNDGEVVHCWNGDY